MLALAGGAGLRHLSLLGADFRAALLYAFGPYEFARRIQVLSGQVAGQGLLSEAVIKQQYPEWDGEPVINRQVHVRDLSDPSSRAVTTPNNDTLYTSAVLDLTVGPVEVLVPDSHARYLSVAFMNPFCDQVAYIGTRATGGRGGRFWILGPGNFPDIPEGVTPIRVDSNDIWMLGRVFVAGEHDLADARLIQSQILARPVNADKTARLFVTKAPERHSAKTFLALTNEILARNASAIHTARASQFAVLGIIAGDLDAFENLSPLAKTAWSRAVKHVEDKIQAQITADSQRAIGWTMPPAILGNYGSNDAVRAGTALIGFGALTINEAAYFKCSTDRAGAPLDGKRSYRIVLPPEGVPTDAFWSLSVYATTPEHQLFFYENALNRNAINSHSNDLKVQEDGSIILGFQREPPRDPSVVWMPTPKSTFECVFRAYLPGLEIREGQWMPPPILSN